MSDYLLSDLAVLFYFIQCIIPILALFHGRLVGRAEQAMPENEYSTGGDVEHEVGTLA